MTGKEQTSLDRVLALWPSLVDKHEDMGYEALSPAEKTTWDVWAFATIATEGFCSYLRVTAGEDVRNLLASLERVGAIALAKGVRKMCGAFPGGMPSADRATRLNELEFVTDDDCEKLVGEEFCLDDDELAEQLCTHLGSAHLECEGQDLEIAALGAKRIASGTESVDLSLDVLLSTYRRGHDKVVARDESGRIVNELPLKDTAHDFILTGMCFLEIPEDKPSITVSELLEEIRLTAKEVYANPKSFDMAKDMPEFKKLHVTSISYEAGDSEWMVFFKP